MSCLLTSGISLGCRDQIGGVAEVYVGAYNGTSMTIAIGTSSNAGQVTAFGGTTVSFYTFAVAQETSSFTETGEFSTENGTSFYTHTLELVIQKLSATYGAIVNTLGQGVWRVLVKTNNGEYYLLGFQNGMRVSAAESGAGKSLGDMSGSKITFQGKEQYVAYQVTSSAALSVIA